MLLMFLWLGVVGFVVGGLGRLLVPGPNRMTMTLTILIGLAGAYTGGLVGNALFGRFWGFLWAVLASALLVLLVDGRDASRSAR